LGFIVSVLYFFALEFTEQIAPVLNDLPMIASNSILKDEV